MTKLGVFVGERGLWTFFRDIYEDLALHFDTSVFSPKEYHPPLLSGRINRWAYRNGIRSMLKRNDVCFFEWASELLEVASHMPKYAPIVTRLHSFELADWAHRIHWDRVDRIIFVSDAIRGKFLARYPEQADKSVLIYNAVSVNKYHPVPKTFDFSIGMLCTISPIKRVYEAIMMVKELIDLGYAPKLHIAGAPAQGNLQDRYYVSVHRLLQKLGLEQTVQFYGHVNDPESWLQKIDVFISNSYWEGLQTALLEAMATGCYCLAHFWDGAEEALPPENIFSTDNELKQKLIEFSKLSDGQQMERKRQLTNIVKSRFSLDDKKSRIREVINSVL